MLLAKEQRIGAITLLSLALIGWFIAAIVQSNQSTPDAPIPPTNSKLTWEQRKDSIRHADSIRYAKWAAEREQRYDSFRIADSIRRAEWKMERQRLFDSTRIADSLWRDSVGWYFAPKHRKKDTILNLNHCDTAELQLLRGIGRFTAIRIVQYREQLGGYYSPAQLTDDYFSKFHLDTLLAHFTADTSDVQTIDVNTCPLDRLRRHPYLRYNQAKAIYTLRRKQVRLRSLDDLRTLPELSEKDLQRLAPYLRFE
jgi:DNA uptake protein ComE-like DNA-binding protein